MQHGQFNKMLYKENFQEHNFLWTQWKKLRHFDHLKKFEGKVQDQITNHMNMTSAENSLEYNDTSDQKQN